MMKKYSQKNWNTLKIALILGLLYAAYRIYSSQGGINSAGLIAFGVVIIIVMIILFVVNKFFREKGEV